MTLPRSAARLLLAAGLVAGGGLVVGRRAERREADARAAYPPQGAFVTLDDGRRVNAVVRGSGPDLVLLHGAGGNVRDFTFSFVDRVAGDYRVIAFDRPGLGYTDRADAALGGVLDTRAESPAEQAAMLAAAARKLGAERPIVLGHSLGGAVALAWALNHGPAALVVLAGVSQPWQARLAPIREIPASPLGSLLGVPLVTALTRPEQYRWILREIFAPQPIPPGYMEALGLPLSLRRSSIRANSRQLTALKRHVTRMSPGYGTIDVPVEVVHGDADRIVPIDVHAVPLARQIGPATLTRLPGIGHMPHHATGAEVAAAVDRAARRAGLR